MKMLVACLIACVMAGCVAAGGNNPHEDSAAQVPPTAGPELCHDGSAPPCTPRS